MFCEKCGKQIPMGSAFCDGCGSPVANQPVQPMAQPVQQPMMQQPIAPQQFASPAVAGPTTTALPGGINVIGAEEEKNAEVEVAGKKINLFLILKVAAIVLILFFFMSNITQKTKGGGISFKISVSFSDLAFDSDESKYTLPALLMLLAPAAIFVATQFGEKIPQIAGKIFKTVFIAAAVGLVACLWFRFVVSGGVKDNASTKISVGYSFFWYLSVLAYAALAVPSFLLSGLKKK